MPENDETKSVLVRPIEKVGRRSATSAKVLHTCRAPLLHAYTVFECLCTCTRGFFFFFLIWESEWYNTYNNVPEMRDSVQPLDSDPCVLLSTLFSRSQREAANFICCLIFGLLRFCQTIIRMRNHSLGHFVWALRKASTWLNAKERNKLRTVALDNTLQPIIAISRYLYYIIPSCNTKLLQGEN